MKTQTWLIRLGAALGTILCATLFSASVHPTVASAATDPSTLVGEGGSFLSPVTNLLLNSDTSQLSPLNPSFSDSNIDNAIADFVGSGPGQFNADFVVSERPLSSAETSTAAADGRSFAYVPFAATPVAIATFAVCNPSDLAQDIVTSGTFCRDIPLTPALVGALLTVALTSASVQPSAGITSPPILAWNDTRLTTAEMKPIPDGDNIGDASNLVPSAENSAVMSLMDSDPTAKADLDNALANPANSVSTHSDAPNEVWPFHGPHAYVGGDEGLLGKELTIIASTNAPAAPDTWGALGADQGNAHDVFPVSAVWTGAPEGVEWNVPTAAIENAASSFVGPTEAAAAAAEASSGVTMDPASNLVTFNAQPSNTEAYNNYLMVESYLVVPTTSLPADKATKLAQFIRFVLGPTAQSEMEVLGAAPATSAEVTAGLKVASQLDAEATGANGSSSSTSTTPGASPTSEGQTAASTTGYSSASGSSSGAANDDVLAFTGISPWPLITGGIVLMALGEAGMRILRRRRVTS